MMEPNKPALLEWAQALESGLYKQTHEQLGRIENGQKEYCCLGVACEVFAERLNLEITWSEVGDMDADGAWGDLHLAVANFLGIERDPRLLHEEDRESTAATLNDSHGYTFPQIAAAIRRTFNLDEVTNETA